MYGYRRIKQGSSKFASTRSITDTGYEYKLIDAIDEEAPNTYNFDDWANYAEAFMTMEDIEPITGMMYLIHMKYLESQFMNVYSK
jgi:hypothetical protein